MGSLFVYWSSVTTLWQFYGVIILTRLLLQGVINLTQPDRPGQVVRTTARPRSGLRQPRTAIRPRRRADHDADDHKRRQLAMGCRLARLPRMGTYAGAGASLDAPAARRHGPSPPTVTLPSAMRPRARARRTARRPGLRSTSRCRKRFGRAPSTSCWPLCASPAS